MATLSACHLPTPLLQTSDNLRLRFMLKYAMFLITSIYASDVEIKTNPSDWSSLNRKPNLHFLGLKCNSHCALMKYFGQTKICAKRKQRADRRHIILLTQISHHKEITLSLQSGLLQNFLARKTCNNSKPKIRGTNTNST